VQALPHLETASFEGNPMTQLPYYRAHVLVQLPQLRTLDGKAVTEEEVARAHGAVFQEASTLAVMVSNACLVHKLSRTAQARARAAGPPPLRWQTPARPFRGCPPLCPRAVRSL